MEKPWSSTNTHAPVAARPARLVRMAHAAMNGVIIGLWLWLYRPVLDYLGVIFSREDFRANQWALIGVIALIAWRARAERVRLRLDTAPRPVPATLALALGGSALYLVAEQFLNVNALLAGLFGLASYGLIGLWMEPRHWRQGLLAAILLIGVLPFGEHIQTFIGYPVRILTAVIVRDGLGAISYTSIGVDTILVFENGIAQVDLPCSGVKSLWAGLLFLLAVTWIERRPLNFRWLPATFVLFGLLLTTNLARVGVLVVIGQVAGWQQVAEMLHVPLGVLGFIGSCAAAVASLHLWQPPNGDLRPIATPTLAAQDERDAPSAPQEQRDGDERQLWVSLVLAAAILAMVLIYATRPQATAALTSTAWEFPAELVTQPKPLKPDEIEWLTRDGAESAEQWRFEWRGVSGSLLLIASSNWRAHHRPERCFEVHGLTLNDLHTYLVRPDLPVRFVSLGKRGSDTALSAVYWFQSADRTTDDYGARIWADLSFRRTRWVLVTILFDGAPDLSAPDLREFYIALHDAVKRHLEGGTPWASES